MNRFIVLIALATFVAGEAPPHVGLTDFSTGGSHDGSSGGDGINEYVDEALLARVADLISRGGDGSGTPQGSEGRQIDSEILTRVSGSLGDDAGSASGPKPVYGAPPKSSAPAELGEPEPAERIAEFDLSAETGDAPSQGGYGGPPPPEDAPAPVYGAPLTGGRPLGGPKHGPPSEGKITLGRPMAAQRVADFSLAGQTAEKEQTHSAGYN